MEVHPIFHHVRNVSKVQANGTISNLMLLLIHIQMFIAESENILSMVSANCFAIPVVLQLQLRCNFNFIAVPALLYSSYNAIGI